MYGLASPPMSTFPMKIATPMISATRATIWPPSGLRSNFRRPSGDSSKRERFASTPPAPSGTTNQNATYSSAPRPSRVKSTMKAARTQETGTPR